MTRNIYGYSINLDERGEFYADLRAKDGATVFEVRSAASEDESDLVQDGYMSNFRDTSGLKTCLVDDGIIQRDALILMLCDAERFWDEQHQEDEEDRAAEVCRP